MLAVIAYLSGATLIFLFTTYSTRWPTFTWAFGRYDYVSMLIIAVALLKKSKHWGAGVAVGIGLGVGLNRSADRPGRLGRLQETVSALR